MNGDILHGQAAVITGSARGIGAAIAGVLASHGAGVVISDINGSGAERYVGELRGRGLSAVAVQADVTRAEGRQACVEATLAEFGRIDILVNNAGIINRQTPEEITEADWDRMMATNLKSTFFLSQLVVPHMRDRGRGKIVNIASMGPRTGGQASPVHYVTSKAGVIGLAKSLARQYARFGVTVNSVCPGMIDTDMIADWTPEMRKMFTEAIPLGRLGTAEDVARAVLFLSSPDSDYVTGVTLDVNGGYYMA